MAIDNIQTDCVAGNMNFRDASGNIIVTIDSANRQMTVPSGSTLTVSGTLTATSYNTSTTHVIAGASGTAGDVAVFPGTASKGKLLVTKANNTNDDTTTLTVAAQSGVRTYTVPDAGASASFVMTQGAQTLAAITTFTLGVTLTTTAPLTLGEGGNIVVGTSTGTEIGTATSQKLAFHGSSPVVQRASAAQTAVVGTGSTQTTPYGFATSAQADAIVTLVNELRAALVEKGIIKGSA